ncbi:hypothetical protein P7L78_06710 [Tistrella bauzanensis]|uniref:hypothetical protein n=1 Tax=Tistrella TaxID=171436 RepID=UPI0031F6A9E0
MSDPIAANARGKWSQHGVPHRDWQCIATRDLREEGEEYMICEMCEVQTIRFVHTMVHPDYPETLDCGCDCAGYMEGNKRRAKERDSDMRRRAARRQKFPDRKGWKVSAKGNPHVKVDGYHCIVARRSNGYSVGITPPLAERPTWGSRTYRTLREAQEGCFDAIEHMRPGKRRT